MHAVEALRDRGLDNPEQWLAALSPQTILDTCRWFDDRRQRGPVGLGLLVQELRAGGKPGWVQSNPRDVVAQSAAYQARVWQWCAESFPDLCDESGLASPFAVAAVFRLHCVVGKGRLTVAEHGHLIRAAHTEALAYFDL